MACFPFAQHFLSDSPGQSSQIKNEEELIKAISNVNFHSMKTFNTQSLKTAFIIGTIVSMLVTISLIIALILK